jgi:hypothetical protein
VRWALSLLLTVVFVILAFAVMSIAEAIVVSGFFSVFQGYSRALVYTVYGVAAVFTSLVGYGPLAMLFPQGPSAVLRWATCLVILGTGAAFFFVFATEVVGGEYTWPTKVFGIILGLSAPLFVGASKAEPPSPSAASETAADSSPT